MASDTRTPGPSIKIKDAVATLTWPDGREETWRNPEWPYESTFGGLLRARPELFPKDWR